MKNTGIARPSFRLSMVTVDPSTPAAPKSQGDAQFSSNAIMLERDRLFALGEGFVSTAVGALAALFHRSEDKASNSSSRAAGSTLYPSRRRSRPPCCRPTSCEATTTSSRSPAAVGDKLKGIGLTAAAGDIWRGCPAGVAAAAATGGSTDPADGSGTPAWTTMTVLVSVGANCGTMPRASLRCSLHLASIAWTSSQRSLRHCSFLAFQSASVNGLSGSKTSSGVVTRGRGNPSRVHRLKLTWISSS